MVSVTFRAGFALLFVARAISLKVSPTFALAAEVSMLAERSAIGAEGTNKLQLAITKLLSSINANPFVPQRIKWDAWENTIGIRSSATFVKRFGSYAANRKSRK